MAVIQSGAGATTMTVDTNSNAARITWYGTDGTPSTNIGKATYMAASAAFSPPATPTDMFTITGSGTKTIRVTRMGYSSIQTTAGVNAIYIVKRSTANSGGTSSSLTVVPNDSNNSAGTATALSYTVNPTLGSTVGTIWSGRVNSPAAATAGIGGLQGVVIDFVDMYGQPICLRGTSQVLAWNFNGAALPAGLSVLAWAQWTEE